MKNIVLGVFNELREQLFAAIAMNGFLSRNGFYHSSVPWVVTHHAVLYARELIKSLDKSSDKLKEELGNR